MEKRFVQKKEYLHSNTVKEKIKGLNNSKRLTMTPQGIIYDALLLIALKERISKLSKGGAANSNHSFKKWKVDKKKYMTNHHKKGRNFTKAHKTESARSVR